MTTRKDAAWKAYSVGSEERGSNALAALAALVFGAAWIVVGVAVADWLVPSFDIASFRAYVGTVALVWAATVVIYLPLYLFGKWREVTGT